MSCSTTKSSTMRRPMARIMPSRRTYFCLRRGHALGFDGNIKQVVETQHGFKCGQHQQREEIFNREQFNHFLPLPGA